jgi:hypothetical protein
VSRPPAVSCEGAPRDLGLDQGRFARHQIATALRGRPAARWLDRWRSDRGRPEIRLGRDLGRYFPHMAERTAGLSRGARVPERSLWGLLAEEVAAESGALLAVEGDPAGIVRSVRSPGADLLVRRSRPGEDFRSIEIAVPGLVPALAGVNEHGLVAAASWLPSAPGSDTDPCRAPGLLLVQDCLQRFSGVEGALGWCQRRPAAGETTLVLADGSGALVAVHVTSRDRRVIQPRDGLLAAPHGAERAEALRKRVANASSRDRAALDAALGAEGEPANLRIHLEAGRPSLGLRSEGATAVEWLDL